MSQDLESLAGAKSQFNKIKLRAAAALLESAVQTLKMDSTEALTNSIGGCRQ